MKIYLSGPITSDPDYRAKFNAAASALTEAGHLVLNPAIQPAGMSRQYYMTAAIGMINEADVVLMLPGWEESAGARAERDYAAWIERGVIYEPPKI